MISHIHPITKQEQPLVDHLECTSRIAEEIGKRQSLQYLSKITGYFHDLGKARVRFDQYIIQAAENPSSAVRGSVNHSSAGAVYIYQRYYRDKPEHKLTAQLIGEAILSHHGLNDCLTPDGKDLFHHRVEKLDELDYEEVIDNFHKMLPDESIPDQWFCKAEIEVQNWLQKVKKAGLSSAYSKFMLERTLLSILIDADRLDTAVFCGDRPSDESIIKNTYLPWEDMSCRLENYLEGLGTKASDEIRNSRMQVSVQCRQAAEWPGGIYRLPVPTGGGKTLAGLRYALHHARIHKKRHIFYIAPYLSILEQNASVFREVLKCDEYILEHHSNVITIDQENETRQEYDRYKHLTENWESPVILTSFVQFLNTLFSDRTQSIRRFHSLADSIIILDEIQSLPIEMISIFNMAMNYLNKISNTTVILCTATQPILDQVDIPINITSPISLIQNENELYQIMKRVDVERLKGSYDKTSLSTFIIDRIKEDNGILLIMNTKPTAREVYQELKSRCSQENEKITVIHLSANMCPQHRLDLLNRLKDILGKEKVICVSTNLIEAGVDISFPCVIRAMAGLQAIAQAAGRCNRNGEKERGNVFLAEYKQERLGSLKQLAVAQKCTRPIVDSFETEPSAFNNDLLSPKAMASFYKRYYHDDKQKRLMNYPIDKLNTNMLELLTVNPAGVMAYMEEKNTDQGPDLKLKQAFKTAGRYFEVISPDTVSVLVPYGEGRELTARLNGNISQEELPGLRRKCQRYMVNLYHNQIDALTGGLYEVASGGILALKERFYDNELGVVSEGKMELLEI